MPNADRKGRMEDSEIRAMKATEAFRRMMTANGFATDVEQLVKVRETIRDGGVALGVGALNFWNLRYDSFSAFPLYFQREHEFQFLVKTEIISLMKSIHNQIQHDNMSNGMLLVGSRGAGKTTAMNYLHTLCETDTPRVDFLECSIQPDLATISDFRRSVNISILLALAHYLGEQIQPISEVYSAIYTGNIEIIDATSERLVALLGSKAERRVIFIDNLDKPSLTSVGMLKKYFEIEQGFYERLLGVPGTTLFISLQRGLSEEFSRSQELSYVYGQQLLVEPWTSPELDELLLRRLQAAHAISNSPPSLNEYISPSALAFLYSSNDYNPRLVIRGFKMLLQKRYEERMAATTSNRGSKDRTGGTRLDLEFVRAHPGEAAWAGRMTR